MSAPDNQPSSFGLLAASAPSRGGAGPSSSWALHGLFLLAVIAAIYFARSLLLPIVLSLVLYTLLIPGVRAMKRLHIPEALGAAVMLIALLGPAGYGIYRLAGPAREWIAEAPTIARQLEVQIRSWRQPMEKVAEAAEQVQNLAVGEGGEAQKVQVRRPGIGLELFSSTTVFLATALSTIILLYFLLASGDLFLRRIVRLLPTWSDKEKAIGIASSIERDMSRYIGTVTIINALLGVAVGIAMALLGLPNPVLWGVMASLANFVPYVGSLVGVAVMTLVSFSATGNLVSALVPPAVFLTLTTVESEVVTPLLLGRRLLINPVVIFVGLMLWTFLWGIPGAILAVPLLVVLKIVCIHVERLRPLAVFLGGDSWQPDKPETATVVEMARSGA